MSRICFNPCFNGSVERGKSRLNLAFETLIVSILVLMEVLREAPVSEELGSKGAVSILVLMEVLREVTTGAKNFSFGESFNPCFNGSVERGQLLPRIGTGVSCFNPCFNGSVERGYGILLNLAPDVGFNPCFNGSVERGSIMQTPNRRLRRRFQSLF